MQCYRAPYFFLLLQTAWLCYTAATFAVPASPPSTPSSTDYGFVPSARQTATEENTTHAPPFNLLHRREARSLQQSAPQKDESIDRVSQERNYAWQFTNTTAGSSRYGSRNEAYKLSLESLNYDVPSLHVPSLTFEAQFLPRFPSRGASHPPTTATPGSFPLECSSKAACVHIYLVRSDGISITLRNVAVYPNVLSVYSLDGCELAREVTVLTADKATDDSRSVSLVVAAAGKSPVQGTLRLKVVSEALFLRRHFVPNEFIAVAERPTTTIYGARPDMGYRVAPTTPATFAVIGHNGKGASRSYFFSRTDRGGVSCTAFKPDGPSVMVAVFEDSSRIGTLPIAAPAAPLPRILHAPVIDESLDARFRVAALPHAQPLVWLPSKGARVQLPSFKDLGWFIRKTPDNATFVEGSYLFACVIPRLQPKKVPSAVVKPAFSVISLTLNGMKIPFVSTADNGDSRQFRWYGTSGPADTYRQCGVMPPCLMMDILRHMVGPNSTSYRSKTFAEVAEERPTLLVNIRSNDTTAYSYHLRWGLSNVTIPAGQHVGSQLFAVDGQCTLTSCAVSGSEVIPRVEALAFENGRPKCVIAETERGPIFQFMREYFAEEQAKAAKTIKNLTAAAKKRPASDGEKLTKDLQHCTEKTEQQQTLIKTKNQRLASQYESLVACRNKTSALERSVSQLTNDARRAKRTGDAAERQVAALQKKIKELEAVVGARDARIKELETGHAKALTQCSAAVVECTTAGQRKEAQCAKDIKKVATEEKEAIARIKSISAELTSTVETRDAFKAKWEASDKALVEARLAQSQLRTECATNTTALQKRLAEAQKEAQDCEQALAQQRTSSNTEKKKRSALLSSCEEKLDKSNDANSRCEDSLKRAAASHKKKEQELAAALTAARTLGTALQLNVTAAQNEVRQQAKKSKSLEAQVAQLTEQRSQQLEDWAAQNATTAQKLRDQETQLQLCKKRASAAEAEHEQLLRRLAERATSTTTTASANALQRKDVHQEMQRRVQEVQDSFATAMADTLAQMKRFRERQEEVEKRNGELQQALAQCTLRAERHLGKLAACTSSNRTVSRTLADVEEQRAGCAKDLDAALKDKTALEAQLEAQREQCDENEKECKASVQDAAEQAAQLNASLAQCTKAKERATAQHLATQEQLDKAQASQQQQLQRWEANATQLRSDVSALQDGLAACKSAADATLKDLETCRQGADHLQVQHNQLLVDAKRAKEAAARAQAACAEQQKQAALNHQLQLKSVESQKDAQRLADAQEVRKCKEEVQEVLAEARRNATKRVALEEALGQAAERGDQLEAELTRCKDDAATANKASANLTARVREVEALLRDAEEDAKREQQLQDTLERNLASCQKSKAEAEACCDSGKASLNQCTAQVRSKEAELAESVTAHQEEKTLADAKLAACSKNYDQLVKEKDNLEQGKKSALDHAKLQALADLEVCRQEAAGLRDAVEKRRADSVAQDDRCRQEKRAMQDAAAEAAASCRDQQRQATEDVGRLEKAMTKCLKERDEAVTANAALNSSFNAVTLSMQKAQQALDQLTPLHTALAAEAKKLKTETADLGVAVDQLNDELNTVRQAKRAQEQDAARTQLALQQTSNELRDCALNLDRAKTRLDAQTDRASSFQAEVSQLKQRAKKQDAAFELSVMQCNDTVQNIAAELDACREAVQDLNAASLLCFSPADAAKTQATTGSPSDATQTNLTVADRSTAPPADGAPGSSTTTVEPLRVTESRTPTSADRESDAAGQGRVIVGGGRDTTPEPTLTRVSSTSQAAEATAPTSTPDGASPGRAIATPEPPAVAGHDETTVLTTTSDGGGSSLVGRNLTTLAPSPVVDKDDPTTSNEKTHGGASPLLPTTAPPVLTRAKTGDTLPTLSAEASGDDKTSSGPPALTTTTPPSTATATKRSGAPSDTPAPVTRSVEAQTASGRFDDTQSTSSEWSADEQTTTSSSSTTERKSNNTGAIVGATSGAAAAALAGGAVVWKYFTRPDAVEAQANELQSEVTVYNWDDENDIPHDL